MSVACSKTREFFLHGDQPEFEAVLALYDQVVRLRADKKSTKPENVLKLDKWYQYELPKKIKSRGKDPHLIHDEIVQVIKWKLARGKFRPNLTNLVQMNTPRVVMTETKKAFRNIYKRNDLQAATLALCNLKGVGPAMASAILAAGAPHIAPFMADECLWAMPDVDSLDYTMKEYMRFVELVNSTVDRLNAQGGNWTPHKVELAIWTYYVANDIEPELLEDAKHGKPSNGAKTSSSSKMDSENGTADKVENGSADNSNMSGGAEDSNLSGAGAEDSNPSAFAEDSNFSATAEDSMSSVAEDSNSAHASNGNGSPAEALPSSNGIDEKVGADSTEHSNGGGESYEDTNKLVSLTPSEVTASSSNPSTETEVAAKAAVEDSAPTEAVEKAEISSSCAIAEAETDTNDSTKENNGAASAASSVSSSFTSSSGQKRPSPTPTEEEEDDEAKESEQPASKKMKEDEAQVVTA